MPLCATLWPAPLRLGVLLSTCRSSSGVGPLPEPCPSLAASVFTAGESDSKTRAARSIPAAARDFARRQLHSRRLPFAPLAPRVAMPASPSRYQYFHSAAGRAPPLVSTPSARQDRNRKTQWRGVYILEPQVTYAAPSVGAPGYHDAVNARSPAFLSGGDDDVGGGKQRGRGHHPLRRLGHVRIALTARLTGGLAADVLGVLGGGGGGGRARGNRPSYRAAPPSCRQTWR